jgi:hypothetical protein
MQVCVLDTGWVVYEVCAFVVRVLSRRAYAQKSVKDAREQVWDTILKREATGMGHIHVCFDVGSCQ